MEQTSLVKLCDSTLSNEASIIVKWEALQSSILIIILTLALILGLLSRMAIINFIFKMASGRPINTNILVDNLIELPSFIILSVMILISLICGKPIEEVFGSEGTYTFWIVGLIHNGSLAVGGCGIAAYRFICIHDLGFALNIQRAEALMKTIMKLELFTEAILVSLSVFAGITSNEAMLLNFARGYSAKMANTINPTTDNETLRQFGRLSLIFVLIIVCGLMILEWICYFAIYREVQSTNEQIKDSISKKTVTYRRKRNIISFSTQVVVFAVEIIVGVTATLIVSFRVADASVFPILGCLGSALVPALHVIGSSEMREYYTTYSWNLNCK